MGNALLNIETYTYDDYIKWDDKGRWELIDGAPYAMAAPSLRHQEILLELGRRFGNHLKGKKCKVFVAPVDVRLNHKTFDNTVVQPDLVIVCNPDIAKGASINGIPDLVIEILSPSNKKYDKITKLELYKNSKIPEIWLVDPEDKTVEVFVLEDDIYSSKYYGDNEIPVDTLEDFNISV